MIEQPAQVIEVNPEWIVVRTEMLGGCQSCGTKSSCGTSLIGQLFPERPRQQLTLSPDAFPQMPQVGDRLVIGIRESYLQQTSLLLYALPLLGLIGGALLGNWLGISLWAEGQAGQPNTDPASMLGGLVGLGASLLLARHWSGGRERAMRNAISVISQASMQAQPVSFDFSARSR